MLKNSTNYSSIRVLILTATAHLLKGEVEHEKKDFRNALSCYTDGIGVKCKDDALNAKLYFEKAHQHHHLGKFTRPFVFRFSLVS